MISKTSMSRHLSAALLIIAVSARLVLSKPNYTNRTVPSSTDSSHLKMEPRGDNDDDNSGISPKAISEISLNVKSSLKVKTDDPASRPSNSIISSRNNFEPRNKIPSNQITTSTKDSYLDALEYSHIIKSFEAYEQQPLENGKLNYIPGPVYRGEDSNSSSSNNDTHSYNKQLETEPKISRISYSGNTYEVPAGPYVPSPPDTYYGEPQRVPYENDYSSYNSYGGYGLPNKNYNAIPLNSYGPPTYSSSNGHPYLPYGTSQQGLGSLQATYSTSHPLPDFFPFTFLPAIDFSWPISLKIDAFTLIKIVLKLIVFKMIVKFIAVICLLIFIPKLIHKKHHHDIDDVSRRFTETPNFPAEQLNLLGSVVMSSIEDYKNMNTNGKKRNETCTDLACQIKMKLFSYDDTWNDYRRLFKAYIAEEQSVQRQNKGNRSRRK